MYSNESLTYDGKIQLSELHRIRSNPEEVTFGHLLSDAGYNTCISGKWQLFSYNPPDERPEMRSKGQRIEDAGFEEFCVWHSHHTEQKGSRYKNPVIYENGNFRDDTDGKYGEDIFCDYIIDYIERKKDDDNPFFVYWPMAATHKPHEPTPDSPNGKTSIRRLIIPLAGRHGRN